MLLATKSGWLILVEIIRTEDDKITVQALDNKQTYTLGPKTKNMKLFGPESTIEDTTKWINQK